MSARSISLPWSTLYSDVNDGTGLFIPVTGWMDAASAARVRFTFEVANTTDGSGNVQGGLQPANNDGSPGTAITVGAQKQGNGIQYPASFADVSSTTGGAQLVRFGFWFKTSAAAMKYARVGGKVDLES